MSHLSRSGVGKSPCQPVRKGICQVGEAGCGDSKDLVFQWNPAMPSWIGIVDDAV